MPEKTLVGIVGLGKIGAAVASHVLAAGYPMLGWARRHESLEEFTRSGGRAVERIPALGAASTVISVVFDDDALREVAFGPGGFVEAMQPGAMHIAMETISPRLARELEAAHAARSQRFLAAPVFGRPEAAVKGELTIMCAGRQDTFHLVDPILSTAGRTRWIGPKPEQAMLVKLSGNQMILTMSELLNDTYQILRAGDVDLKVAKEALIDELMPRVFAGYAQRQMDEPEAGRPAATRIGRKDMALLIEAAGAQGTHLALAKCISDSKTN